MKYPVVQMRRNVVRGGEGETRGRNSPRPGFTVHLRGLGEKENQRRLSTSPKNGTVWTAHTHTHTHTQTAHPQMDLEESCLCSRSDRAEATPRLPLPSPLFSPTTPSKMGFGLTVQKTVCQMNRYAAERTASKSREELPVEAARVLAATMHAASCGRSGRPYIHGKTESTQ